MLTNDTAITLDKMLKLSQEELDNLFRNSPAGEIPTGEGNGIAIVAPGTELSEVASKLIHLIAWQGKVFDPEKGELRNKILPVGVQAIIATVYKQNSWFDDKECIVLDYSKTSLIAHWIRDEMREVAPGIYLGIVYWDKAKLLNFALQFPQSGI